MENGLEVGTDGLESGGGEQALCEGAEHMDVQRRSKRVCNESERGAGEKVM